MARATKTKDLNLMLAMDRAQGGSKMSSGTRLVIFAGIGTMLIICGFIVFSKLQVASLLSEKSDLEDYIKDSAVIRAYDEAGKLDKETRVMQAQVENLKSMLLDLSSYPDMTEQAFSELYAYAGKRVNLSDVRYDRTAGTLKFTAESSTVTGVSIFVTQLRRSGIFDDIFYEGYQRGDEESMSYTFSVTCIVHMVEPELPKAPAQNPVENGGAQQ